MSHADPPTGQDRTPVPSDGAPWWVPFLVVLAETGNVSAACIRVQIARSTAYEARDRHPEFARAWDEALEFAADALELEARRRAAEGTLEPVFYKGFQVGTIRRYSDQLLMFLLRAARPLKFRERVALDLERAINLSTLTDAQIERIAAGEDPAHVILSPAPAGAGGAGAPPSGGHGP